MTTQDFIFQNAELSIASYAVLDFGVTNTDKNLDALVRAGMTLSQSEDFARRFPVVITQYADILAPGGMGTGFNATVFKDSSTPGNITLAIRGTDALFSNDAAADSSIAVSGAAYDQIVAMVNWWLRATTLKDQTVN